MHVNKSDLTIRGEDGRIQTVSAKQAKSFDVLERQSIEIAAADKLLLTGNFRKRGFRCTNGEIVTVSGWIPEAESTWRMAVSCPVIFDSSPMAMP